MTRNIKVAIEQIENTLYSLGLEHVRNINATLIAPVLKITGFRFSKDYRQGATIRHQLVHMLVNTVQANTRAA